MVNCSVRTQPLPKNLVECLSYHLKSPLFPLLLIIIRTIFFIIFVVWRSKERLRRGAVGFFSSAWKLFHSIKRSRAAEHLFNNRLQMTTKCGSNMRLVFHWFSYPILTYSLIYHWTCTHDNIESVCFVIYRFSQA